MLAAFTLTMGVNATTLNEDGHFYCDFSLGDEDFNPWTVVSDGNDDGRWGGLETSQMAPVHFGGYDESDDYLFSPKITLPQGKEYIVKINLWADWPCDMQVTAGHTLEPSDQTAISEVERFNGDHYVAYKMPSSINGDIHVGIRAVTEAGLKGYLYVKSVEVAEARDGSIAFTLVDSREKAPVADVDLKLTGDTYRQFTIRTNSEGKALFEHLTPGVYTVDFDFPGLIKGEPVEVTVADNTVVDYKIDALTLPMVAVRGVLSDSKKRPLADAQITLAGELATYSAVSDASGAFEIKNVFGENSYELNVSKDLKEPYEKTVKLGDTDLNLGQIDIANFFSAPAGVSADLTENGMFVSWAVSLSRKDFLHDSGNYGGVYALSPREGAYVRFGVKFDEPMTLDEINWVVTELTDGKVDVFVYPIGRDGAVAKSPVYEALGVPSDTYDWQHLIWQTHRMTHSVSLPYGCIIAIGHVNEPDNNISMPCDYRNNGPSYEQNNDGDWVSAYVSNFLIRGKGTSVSREVAVEPFAAAALRSVSTPRKANGLKLEGTCFNVWRVNGDADAVEPDMTPIATGHSGLYVFDREFDKLSQGVYRYGVQAVSDDGRKSDIIYSSPIAHKMTTDVTLKLYANTALPLSNGARVTLQGTWDGAPSYAGVIEDETLSFGEIAKGEYVLTAEKYGFQTINETLNLSSESSYTILKDFWLTPLPPFSLSAEQEEATGGVMLSWNRSEGIFEDFEGMNDFEINPAGELGWTYADLDKGVTYGVAQCQQSPYPNMHSPMAFMAFNPTATTPDVSDLVRPYSGKKVLIDASLESGARNDDYLFSPVLEFDTPFTFRFMAASGFYGLLGNEEFMVGYSTTDADPGSVIWITDESEKVSGAWTRYEYTLPADARHAVIRCVSKDCLFFMLDDIFIGREESDIFNMTSYNVTLDGEAYTTTTGRSLTFENLEEGRHIATVQTVYTLVDGKNSYSEPVEIMFEARQTGGIDEVSIEPMHIYDSATKTLRAGRNVTLMEVIDLYGRTVATGDVIDLSSKASDVYILRITDSEGQTRCYKLAI